MKREAALNHAKKVAKLLLLGAEALIQHESPAAEILEIVIFGSAARGKENPNDVDLMMFDRGYYSNTMSFEARRLRSDWYGRLKDNLEQIVTRTFGFQPNGVMVNGLLSDARVDLHVLPIEIFTDPFERSEVARLHRDPHFFQNAFSSMLRFDRDAGDFVPTDSTYFENKYRDRLPSATAAEHTVSI